MPGRIEKLVELGDEKAFLEKIRQLKRMGDLSIESLENLWDKAWRGGAFEALQEISFLAAEKYLEQGNHWAYAKWYSFFSYQNSLLLKDLPLCLISIQLWAKAIANPQKEDKKDRLFSIIVPKSLLWKLFAALHTNVDAFYCWEALKEGYLIQKAGKYFWSGKMPEEMPSLPVPAPIWIKPERSKRRGSWSKTLSGLLIEEATIEDYQNFINRGFTSHDFLRTFSRLYSGEAERERVPAKVEAETLRRIALDFYTRGFDRLPKYTEILRFTGFFT